LKDLRIQFEDKICSLMILRAALSNPIQVQQYYNNLNKFSGRGQNNLDKNAGVSNIINLDIAKLKKLSRSNTAIMMRCEELPKDAVEIYHITPIISRL
jgi:hypothetical protein